MRIRLCLIPLSLCATPAWAQAVAPPLPPEPQVTQIAPETAERLVGSVQALSEALLDLKVGGAQAALEGREPTRAERNETVRQLGRRKDPNFDRDIQRQIAAAKPRMEQSIQALNQALPEIAGDLQRARTALERAIANMPDPNYPRR